MSGKEKKEKKNNPGTLGSTQGRLVDVGSALGRGREKRSTTKIGVGRPTYGSTGRCRFDPRSSESFITF